MPMVRMQLSCGCFVIAAYVGRVKFSELSKIEQSGIRMRVLANHKCPEKRTPAPATSPEPQKP